MEIKKYLNFIYESTKYKSMDSENFIKLFSKIVNHYKETNAELLFDFKYKLFEYVSQDESQKFPINFFDKEYKNLTDIIHLLDNKNSEILLHKNRRKVIDVSLPDLEPVWKDDDKKIYVYHAITMFDSIALGKGTNFCVSADYRNGNNWFYNYVYYLDSQNSSMYFVKSPNQLPEYQTLCIDIKKDGSFLYTDVRNIDMNYSSYKLMLDTDYTSPDLNNIPKNIFKFIITTPTKEEVIESFRSYNTCNTFGFHASRLILVNRDKNSILEIFDELLLLVKKEKKSKIDSEFSELMRWLYDVLRILISPPLNNKERKKLELEDIIPILIKNELFTIKIIQYLYFGTSYLGNLFDLTSPSPSIDRKVKILLLIVTICRKVNSIHNKHIYRYNFNEMEIYLELINLSKYNNKSYKKNNSFIYDFMKENYGYVKNITVEEIKIAIEEYLKLDQKKFYIYATKSYLLTFKKLIDEHGEDVLNLIYYKERYTDLYGNTDQNSK